MKLSTAVTLLLSVSLATSRWCWDGKVSYDLDWREYDSRFCGEEERYCHVYHYTTEGYRQLGCGRCTGPDEQYCEECSYEDLCNYEEEASGAGHLPTTVSLLVPAAYFLAKLA